MRVTAGVAKGTRLRTASRAATRPTSDMVKEALFNALAPRLEEARVLDLFAGTGGLGIEALSRGAGAAVFVEREPRGAAMIRENLRAARLEARGEVRRANALTEVASLAARGARFDVIVLDPPYGQELAGRILRAIAAAGALAPGGPAAPGKLQPPAPTAVKGPACGPLRALDRLVAGEVCPDISAGADK